MISFNVLKDVGTLFKMDISAPVFIKKTSYFTVATFLKVANVFRLILMV